MENNKVWKHVSIEACTYMCSRCHLKYGGRGNGLGKPGYGVYTYPFVADISSIASTYKKDLIKRIQLSCSNTYYVLA